MNTMPEKLPPSPQRRSRLSSSLQTLRYWTRASVRGLKCVWDERRLYHTARQLDPRVEFHGQKLGFHYYYQKGLTSLYPKKDSEGFAIIEFYGKWVRQPLTHCHWTMHYFHDYLESGKEEDKARFLHAVDLLMKARTTAVLGGITCDVWYFDFEIPSSSPHRVPWVCGLAQGWAIAVLTRAWQMTGKEEYLQAAKNASALYDVNVDDGGIRSTDAQGNIYYEEYPFPDGGNHVLNGYLSAIIGVYDLYRATGDERAKRLFQQGVNTLKAPGVLDRYDTGSSSVYDQASIRNKMPLTLHYHRVHIRQLTVMHKITGEDLFDRTATKWYRYGVSPGFIMRNSWLRLRYQFLHLPRYVRKLAGR